jgi:hypothetical protein
MQKLILYMALAAAASAQTSVNGKRDFVEMAAPANPPAGFERVYAKTGSGLCALDSSGTERCTGSGGVVPAVKTLYYAPAAKNIGGVGASAFQCIVNCPVATAINSGSAATASLNVTLGTSNQTSQDQFIVPGGYANQQITAEVTFFSGDSAHAGSFTLSVINVSTGTIANPTFAAVCSNVTLTPAAASGRTTATCTFTPSWTSGDEIFWKLAWTTTTLTSDLQVLAVRFYATF